MLNLIRRLLGRKPVYLIMHDGRVLKRWAKNNGLCYECRRYAGMEETTCLLFDGGKVMGPCYVTGWIPAEGKLAELEARS